MAINPIEYIKTKGKQVPMSPSVHIEPIFNNRALHGNLTRKDHNHIVVIKKRASEDRSYIQPLIDSPGVITFRPEKIGVLNDKRIFKHKIITNAKEKPIDSFLSKLEQTLIENKAK